jgi:hypothetical protein
LDLDVCLVREVGDEHMLTHKHQGVSDGLQLLVYEALSYKCMGHQATSSFRYETQIY